MEISEFRASRKPLPKQDWKELDSRNRREKRCENIFIYEEYYMLWESPSGKYFPLDEFGNHDSEFATLKAAEENLFAWRIEWQGEN